MRDHKLIARRKLLSIMPRIILEELAQLERPWNVDRLTLLKAALEKYDADLVEQELERIINATITKR